MTEWLFVIYNVSPFCYVISAGIFLYFFFWVTPPPMRTYSFYLLHVNLMFYISGVTVAGMWRPDPVINNGTQCDISHSLYAIPYHLIINFALVNTSSSLTYASVLCCFLFLCAQAINPRKLSFIKHPLLFAVIHVVSVALQGGFSVLPFLNNDPYEVAFCKRKSPRLALFQNVLIYFLVTMSFLYFLIIASTGFSIYRNIAHTSQRTRNMQINFLFALTLMASMPVATNAIPRILTMFTLKDPSIGIIAIRITYAFKATQPMICTFISIGVIRVYRRKVVLLFRKVVKRKSISQITTVSTIQAQHSRDC
uniref:G_PROTEIN_RECEP_F1_2 domain-containing protein n=1 Tax=Steinernema glaseri TaxID=37863 RepID=A0A1I7YJM8_9BILA